MSSKLQNELIKNHPTILHLLIGNTIPDVVNMRKVALDQFTHMSLPNNKQPFWRYAQCEKIFNQEFNLLTHSAFDQKWLEKIHSHFKESILLFFINGNISETYSSNIHDTPISIQSFKQLEQKQPQLLVELLLSSLSNTNIFSLMNLLFLTQGALIIIPDSFKSVKPIIIVNCISKDNVANMLHSQLHIIIEKNAQAQVLEYQYVSDAQDIFTNIETNIRCDEKSLLEYTYIAQNSTNGYHHSHRTINQHYHSECITNDLLIGGEYHRHQCHYFLHAEQTKTTTQGLMLPIKNGIQDMINCLEHHVAHGESQQQIKSLIPDFGHAAFTGNIRVNKNAQNTDAKMDCHHLILGNLGKADASPQFEIFTDDVQCNHGATITQLNEDELFYLNSRSIPVNRAKSLLTKAFIAEWIDSPENILSDFCSQLINEQCNKIFRGL